MSVLQRLSRKAAAFLREVAAFRFFTRLTVRFSTIFRGIRALTLLVFKLYYERTTMLAHR